MVCGGEGVWGVCKCLAGAECGLPERIGSPQAPWLPAVDFCDLPACVHFGQEPFFCIKEIGALFVDGFADSTPLGVVLVACNCLAVFLYFGEAV